MLGKHSRSDSARRSSPSEVALENTRPVRSRSSDAAIDRTVQVRQKHRVRRVLLIVLAVFLVLVVAAGAWAWTFINAVNGDLRHSDPKVAKALTPVTQPTKKLSPAPAPFTILLLGTDNRGVAGDARTDSILLARVDPAKKRVWLLSLPRDTRAEISGDGVGKLNKAYTLGGAAATIDTVEKLLGVPVNHYMEVNVNGFKRIVEVLGGVWVDVDVEIDDPKAAAANPGREGQHIEPGYQKLSPAEALVYVRSRDFPDADFTRMRHQQEFFKAIAKQSITFGNVFKIPKLVRETSRFTLTDMSVGELVRIARSLRGISDESLDTATLPGEWRSPYVWLDEEAKADLVTRMTAGRSFEDSTVVGVSVPSDTAVSVRNGSGTAGVATKAGAMLSNGGFDVQEISNAKRSNYPTTLIIYGENRAEAQAVTNQLGQGQLVQDGGQYKYTTDVLVVIGQDFDASAKPKVPPEVR